MPPVLSEYLPILVLAALAFIFAVASLAASSTLRPNQPDPRQALRVRVRQRPGEASAG